VGEDGFSSEALDSVFVFILAHIAVAERFPEQIGVESADKTISLAFDF